MRSPQGSHLQRVGPRLGGSDADIALWLRCTQPSLAKCIGRFDKLSTNGSGVVIADRSRRPGAAGYFGQAPLGAAAVIGSRPRERHQSSYDGTSSPTT